MQHEFALRMEEAPLVELPGIDLLTVLIDGIREDPSPRDTHIAT
jgi:hypothetical protein